MLVFNLVVTFWIGEHLLGLVGTLLVGFFLILAFFFTLQKLEHVTASVVHCHLLNFPHSRGAAILFGVTAAAAVEDLPVPGLGAEMTPPLRASRA